METSEINYRDEWRNKMRDFLKDAPPQFHSLHNSDLFDFFYSEIEGRNKSIKILANELNLQEQELASLRKAMEAAQEFIKNQK